MSRIKKENKTNDPLDLLNLIWQFIHDKLNENIQCNKKEGEKTLGDVASFIRNNCSQELLKKFNIKEYYK